MRSESSIGSAEDGRHLRSAVQNMKQQFTLPSSVHLLEEANLPADLARSLAGQSVVVKVLAEESYAYRERPDRKDYLLAKGDGDSWNAYQPTRILFKDADGRSWCLPRSWLGTAHWESQVNWTCSDIEGIATLIEGVNLPSFWDCWKSTSQRPKHSRLRASGHLSRSDSALANSSRLSGATQKAVHGEFRRIGAGGASSCQLTISSSRKGFQTMLPRTSQGMW